MSTDAGVESRPTTTFPHRPRKRISRTLLGFVVLSLFAHGFAFLLFRVVYPRAVTILPPTPTVSLLTPGTPEQEALLRWVVAEDPSLVATSLAAEPPLQVAQEYRPSYATFRTPPRTYPLDEEPMLLIPARIGRSTGTVPGGSALAETPRSSASTAVVLSGGLSGRALRKKLTWKADRRGPLQPASFLVGADHQGTVKYLFLQRTSGDAEADGHASIQLRNAQLSASDAPLTWGWATIHWGDDVYVTATEP